MLLTGMQEQSVKWLVAMEQWLGKAVSFCKRRMDMPQMRLVSGSLQFLGGLCILPKYKGKIGCYSMANIQHLPNWLI